MELKDDDKIYLLSTNLRDRTKGTTPVLPILNKKLEQVKKVIFPRKKKRQLKRTHSRSHLSLLRKTNTHPSLCLPQQKVQVCESISLPHLTRRRAKIYRHPPPSTRLGPREQQVEPPVLRANQGRTIREHTPD